MCKLKNFFMKCFICCVMIGSVYHWTGMIVPRKYGPLAAYACGWANFLGNAAGDAVFASSWASFVYASAQVTNNIHFQNDVVTNMDQPGPQVGLSIAIIIVWTVLNFLNISQVGWMNGVAGKSVFFICLL